MKWKVRFAAVLSMLSTCTGAIRQEREPKGREGGQPQGTRQSDSEHPKPRRAQDLHIDRKLGHYKTPIFEKQRQFFEAAQFPLFYVSPNVAQTGPLHSTGEPCYLATFDRDDKPGVCEVEVSWHSNEGCVSRRMGLLLHDLRFAALVLNRVEGRVISIAGQRVAWLPPKDKAGTDWAFLLWMSGPDVAVVIKFRDHRSMPEIDTDPVVAAYLERYPSNLPEDFLKRSYSSIMKNEADKALEFHHNTFFAAMAMYPWYENTDFNIEAIRRLHREPLRDWWKKNRDRPLSELRTECIDGFVEYLKKLEGMEAQAERRCLAEKLYDVLGGSALFPGIGWTVLETEAPDREEEWTGRYELWKDWWGRCRGKTLREQWRAMLDVLIERLSAWKFPPPQERDYRRIACCMGKIIKLAQTVPEDIPKDKPGKYPAWGDTSQYGAMSESLKRWWKKNRDTYVPDRVLKQEKAWEEDSSW